MKIRVSVLNGQAQNVVFSEKNKFGFNAIPRLPVITLVWHYGFTNLDKVPYFPLEWGEVKPGL